MAKMTLFAVPYAGGSATAIFSKWKTDLGPDIQLVPLEYAGHGMRMGEAFMNSMQETVADLMKKIRPVARVKPYSIYAHSMGCAVVYELLQEIAIEKLPQPESIFLSGRNPPHKHYNANLHKLSDEEFLEEIRAIGGTSKDFFEMKELVKTFLPILRNDYKIVEQYQMQLPIYKTSADIIFFYSDQDAMVTAQAITEWSHYTHGNFILHKYHGDHFFIHNHHRDICLKIRKQLFAEQAMVVGV